LQHALTESPAGAERLPGKWEADSSLPAARTVVNFQASSDHFNAGGQWNKFQPDYPV
jgi:hypothetical protein